jgi:hypothetical protein
MSKFGIGGPKPGFTTPGDVGIVTGPAGPAGPGVGVDDILMETGDHLLLETGDAILLE